MIPFVKMQGIGNDFVVLDAFQSPLPEDLAALAKTVCDRRFGVGGDGILTLEKSEKAAFQMRMFNPDGTESEMCGNGLRCVGALAHHRGYDSDGGPMSFETGAGILTIEVEENSFRIDMGKYDLSPSSIGLEWEGERFVNELVSKSMRGTAVSMGNPHLVLICDDVDAVDLAHVGPILETHPWFKNRTNVHFIQVLSRDHLKQRTWERGAGITLACGTGACACGVAAYLNGVTDANVNIDLPGGRLMIEVGEDQTVWMTGPAVIVFEGELSA